MNRFNLAHTKSSKITFVLWFLAGLLLGLALLLTCSMVMGCKTIPSKPNNERTIK